jgi:hypothetical protein
MNRTDYLNFLQQQPQLTAYGFDVPAGVDMVTERRNLENAYREFTACRNFLANRRKRKTINPKAYSYWLKHDVERWVESTTGSHLYISEGTLIAAALTAGFTYRKGQNNWSAYFNIGK